MTEKSSPSHFTLLTRDRASRGKLELKRAPIKEIPGSGAVYHTNRAQYMPIDGNLFGYFTYGSELLLAVAVPLLAMNFDIYLASCHALRVVPAGDICGLSGYRRNVSHIRLPMIYGVTK